MTPASSWSKAMAVRTVQLTDALYPDDGTPGAPRSRARPSHRDVLGRAAQAAQRRVLAGERRHAERERHEDLDRLERQPIGERLVGADAPAREHEHASGLEDADVRGRDGHD